MTSSLPVIQADREAAADCGRAIRWLTTSDAKAVRAGQVDTTALVQAFASHRTASIEPLVEALEKARGYVSDVAEGLVTVLSDSDPRAAALCDLEQIDAALAKIGAGI